MSKLKVFGQTETTVTVGKICSVTGDPVTVTITKDQLHRLQKGFEMVQIILPEVPREKRELFLSGFTPEEWKAIFGEEE